MDRSVNEETYGGVRGAELALTGDPEQADKAEAAARLSDKQESIKQAT